MITVGLPMFFLWVFGIPFAAFFILFRNRHLIYLSGSNISTVMRERKRLFESQMAFMYRGYLPTRYYWFLLEMSRKAALVAVSVFFPGALHTQLLMASMLIFLCILAQVAGRPFENRITEYAEYVSLFTAFMIFYLANFLFIDAVSEANKQLVTFLIIALVLIFVACIVTSFIKLTREEMQLGPLRRRIQAGHAKGEDIGRILREWRIEQRQKEKAKEEARMLKLQKRNTLTVHREDSSDDEPVARGAGAQLDLNLDAPTSAFHSTLQEINDQVCDRKATAGDVIEDLGENELGQGEGVYVNNAEILDVQLSESSDSEAQAPRPLHMGFDLSDHTDTSDSDGVPLDLHFHGNDDTLEAVSDVDMDKKRSYLSTSRRSEVETVDDTVYRPAAAVPVETHADRYAGVGVKYTDGFQKLKKKKTP
jgi:hypothetical protein